MKKKRRYRALLSRLAVVLVVVAEVGKKGGMEERERRRESGGERRAGEKRRPKHIKTVSPAMGLPPKVKSRYPHQGSGLETSFPHSDPSRGGSVSALYDWLGALPFLVGMHLFRCAWPKQGLGLGRLDRTRPCASCQKTARCEKVGSWRLPSGFCWFSGLFSLLADGSQWG